MRWKRKAYATLPSLRQYVFIAQDAIAVISFDRNDEFAERRFELPDGDLDLPAIGVRLASRDIYRDAAVA